MLINLAIDFDPTLVVCFEGLLETDHPYSFASRQCIKELLATDNAQNQIAPIIGKLISPLRTAFFSNTDNFFDDNLEILQTVI